MFYNPFAQAVRSNPANFSANQGSLELIEYAQGMGGQSAGPQFYMGNQDSEGEVHYSTQGQSRDRSMTGGSRSSRSGKSSNRLQDQRAARRSRASSRFVAQPADLEFIEYARGMDGRSVGPQFSMGEQQSSDSSSKKPVGRRSRTSSQTDARFRGQGRPTSSSISTTNNRLIQNQRNQSIARQMLTAISNAAVNSTNAYLALRALEGYAQDSTTAQRAVEERRYYSNLRTEINQAMSNPERIRQFVETQGPSILQRTQSAYESRKQQILAML
jgi:hypothetical protein